MTYVNDTIIRKKSKTNLKGNFSVSSIWLSLFIILIMILILVDPVPYSKSIINGLSLYFTAVLPGLLPFMFLCKLLTHQNVINKLAKPIKKPIRKLFGVSEQGFYAFLMSMLSGYPIGSKITSDLYNSGKLHKNELTKTALISSTAGPIFVIGAVGGLMLKNTTYGLVIYICNIISVILTSLFLHLFSKKYTPVPIEKKDQRTQTTLSALTQDTTLGLLTVGFYIALFTLVIDLLTNLKILPFISSLFTKNPENMGAIQGIMSGIIEMTNGCKLLSSSITPFSLASISFLITFSGSSIIVQALAFLSTTPVKPYKFILGKLVQAVVSFVITFLIFSFML